MGRGNNDRLITNRELQQQLDHLRWNLIAIILGVALGNVGLVLTTVSGRAVIGTVWRFLT